jgi:tetratricopeptide (TPR) repeat protein
MGFLQALRYAVTGNTNVRGRTEAERLNGKVIRLFEEGRFPEATAAARQLLEMQRLELGENHPDYATSLSNLALLLQRQGDLAGAEPLLRQVLALRTTLLGNSHPDRATALNNLGELLSVREDLEGGERLLREALAIRREMLGDAHPDCAGSMNSLALLLKKRCDLDGAESLLRQALEIRRQTLGEFDPEYATGLSNLALLLSGRGDLTEAEALLRQAWEIRRAALGEQHPDSLATAKSLARVRKCRGDGDRLDERTVEVPVSNQDSGLAPIWHEEPHDRRSPGAVIERDRARAETGLASADATGSATSAARGIDVAVAEAVALTEMFAVVGQRLSDAGHQMRAEGRFPDGETFRGLAACHTHLSTLRAEVRELAVVHGVPRATEESFDGLNEIESLLERVAESAAEELRSRACGVLERVLALATDEQGDVELSALHECQAIARELHGIIASSPASALPPVVDQLGSDSHPFCSLLALADSAESPNPATRIALKRAVEWAYGRELADRAADGHVFLPKGPGSPDSVDGSCSNQVHETGAPVQAG